jgi:hypothetical protein
MMQTILKGFAQKSGETMFSIAVIAKHKSKIETRRNDKIDKWRNLNMEI